MVSLSGKIYGWIKSNDLIKTKDFDLIAIEGSEVTLGLQTKDATAKIHTGAEVFLSGSTDTFQARVNSGAVLDAYRFKTNICCQSVAFQL